MVQVQSPPQTQTFVKTANPITITATATKTATVTATETVVQAPPSNNPQKVVVTATIGGDQQHQLNNNNNNSITCEAQFGQRYRKLCKQNGFDRMAKKNTCATSTCTIDECCR